MKTLLLPALFACALLAASCGNGNNEANTKNDTTGKSSFPSDTTQMNSAAPDTARGDSSLLRDTSLTKAHP